MLGATPKAAGRAVGVLPTRSLNAPSFWAQFGGFWLRGGEGGEGSFLGVTSRVLTPCPPSCAPRDAVMSLCPVTLFSGEIKVAVQN